LAAARGSATSSPYTSLNIICSLTSCTSVPMSQGLVDVVLDSFFGLEILATRLGWLSSIPVHRHELCFNPIPTKKNPNRSRSIRYSPAICYSWSVYNDTTCTGCHGLRDSFLEKRSATRADKTPTDGQGRRRKQYWTKAQIGGPNNGNVSSFIIRYRLLMKAFTLDLCIVKMHTVV
jgi:hypothetical protein